MEDGAEKEGDQKTMEKITKELEAEKAKKDMKELSPEDAIVELMRREKKLADIWSEVKGYRKKADDIVKDMKLLSDEYAINSISFLEEYVLNPPEGKIALRLYSGLFVDMDKLPLDMDMYDDVVMLVSITNYESEMGKRICKTMDSLNIRVLSTDFMEKPGHMEQDVFHEWKNKCRTQSSVWKKFIRGDLHAMAKALTEDFKRRCRDKLVGNIEEDIPDPPKSPSANLVSEGQVTPPRPVPTDMEKD